MKPNEFKCANPECGMTLFKLKAADLGEVTPRTDDILVCGGCGGFSKVTIEGTAILTMEEFNKLNEEEQRDLRFASRAVQSKHAGSMRDRVRKAMRHDRN